MAPSGLVEVEDRRFRGVYYLTMEAVRISETSVYFYKTYTAPYSKKLSPSYSPSWEPQIRLQYIFIIQSFLL
jgi:hypothetical protein